MPRLNVGTKPDVRFCVLVCFLPGNWLYWESPKVTGFLRGRGRSPALVLVELHSAPSISCHLPSQPNTNLWAQVFLVCCWAQYLWEGRGRMTVSPEGTDGITRAPCRGLYLVGVRGLAVSSVLHLCQWIDCRDVSSWCPGGWLSSVAIRNCQCGTRGKKQRWDRVSCLPSCPLSLEPGLPCFSTGGEKERLGGQGSGCLALGPVASSCSPLLASHPVLMGSLHTVLVPQEKDHISNAVLQWTEGWGCEGTLVWGMGFMGGAPESRGGVCPEDMWALAGPGQAGCLQTETRAGASPGTREPDCQSQLSPSGQRG